MRVFVCGATGVLGRRVVKLLASEGHQVIGLSRSIQNSEWLSANGAEPRHGDIFNLEQVAGLSADSDVILHLATAIPNKTPNKISDWALNDRLRQEGTRNLIEAALRNRCRIYIQQSVTFLYGDQGGAWVDETTPIPQKISPVLHSAVKMEQIVNQAISDSGLPAVTLRCGMFYSHDSTQTRAMFEMLRRRRFPLIGNGSAYWNLINVDDAAAAVIAAIRSHPRSIGQIFNICDDEPVRYRDLLGFLSNQLGAKAPGRIPALIGRLMLGSHALDVITASAQCKNQKAKEILGWAPKYPTFREGMRAEISKWLKKST